MFSTVSRLTAAGVLQTVAAAVEPVVDARLVGGAPWLLYQKHAGDALASTSALAAAFESIKSGGAAATVVVLVPLALQSICDATVSGAHALECLSFPFVAMGASPFAFASGCVAGALHSSGWSRGAAWGVTTGATVAACAVLLWRQNPRRLVEKPAHK